MASTEAAPRSVRIAGAIFRNGMRRQRINFYDKLTAGLRAGISLDETLQELTRRARRRGETDVEALVYGFVERQLRDEGRFAEALAPWVPANEAQLIYAGEEQGQIAEGAAMASRLSQRVSEIRGALGRALGKVLLYTALILGLFFLIGYGFVPQLTTMFGEPDEWEGIAQVLGWVSAFVHSPVAMAFFFGAFVIVGVLTSMSLSRWHGPSRDAADRVPAMPWATHAVVSGASWIMAIGAMVRAGASIDEAVRATSAQARSVGDEYLARRIAMVRQRLKRGGNIGDAMMEANPNWPTRDIVDDVSFFARMRNFDDKLVDMGDEAITRAVSKVELYGNIIQYVAMAALVGLIVLLLVSIFALILPLLQEVRW